ncbi:MAG: hypothetical protein DIU78_014970 [Pseudomonadota bacterium]
MTTANGAFRARRAEARAPRFRWRTGVALLLAVAASAACAAELEEPSRFTPGGGLSTGGSTIGSGGFTGGTTGGTAGSGGTTGGTAGSGGTAGGGSGSPIPAETAACWESIVTMKCFFCHFNANTPGKLDMSGGSAEHAARMKNVPATNDSVANPGTCAPGEKLIDPINVDNSVLLKRLNGTQSCGSSMPQGLAPLTAAEMTCVRNWVMSVAASN